MKRRIECATAQNVSVPLNKNGWCISRNDFVTVRGIAFKSQSVKASRPVVNQTWDVTVGSRRQYWCASRKQIIWTAVSRRDC